MHMLCDLEVGNWARGRAPLVMRISFASFHPGLVLLVIPPRLGCQETVRPHPLVAIPPSIAHSGSCGGSCTSPCPGRCDLQGIHFLSALLVYWPWRLEAWCLWHCETGLATLREHFKIGSATPLCTWNCNRQGACLKGELLLRSGLCTSA